VLRIRFYNRRLLTSTRRKNTIFGDYPPSAVEKPHRRSASRSAPKHGVAAVASRKTPDHLAVIRPPTAPCLTARRRLWTGRAVARALSRRARRAQQLFRLLHASPAEPSDAPGRLKRGTRERSDFPSLISMPRAARQCDPLSRDRGAFHRGSPDRAPSRAPAWSAATRWPTGAAAACIHRCSKTSTRPFFRTAFAGASWPRALPRLLQIDVSTSTAMDPSNIPDQRNLWSGRLPSRSIVAFRSAATAEGTQGQGPRITEPRRSLPGLLPRVTSPQPRSPQTPRVAGIVHHPVRS
jgi:hypothetical protein